MRRFSPVLLLLFVAACAAPPSPPAPERPFFSEEGTASWYGKSHQGKRTADGERFDMHAFTAAHRSLSFNTVLRVTNLANGRMVRVRVNDRGPYVGSRILDLSAAAATALGMHSDGIAHVRIEAFAADQPQNRVGFRSPGAVR
jgi:rare lipoprotein A